jgi:plastocyanin
MKSAAIETFLQIAGNSAIAALLCCATFGSAAGQDSFVDQHGLRFNQSSLSIKAGDTLHFHNSDDVIHNIMVLNADDEAKDEGLQKPGEVITATFEQAGEYQVRCAIHPKMKMTVVVSAQ